MFRNAIILLAAAIVVGLPFALRPKQTEREWKAGDPVLTIVSPHNEAIRHEFEHGFSKWHQQKFGKPVKIEWLSIGGTSEISRYLTSEYVAAARAWWKGQGKPWAKGASEALVDRRFNTEKPPQGMDEARWKELRELYLAFRATDDPRAFTCKIDLFFGGGEYDHTSAFGQGLTVAPWKKGEEPKELFKQEFIYNVFEGLGQVWTPKPKEGTLTVGGTITTIDLIPERMSGETWRTPYLFGNVVSTFGICYNLDRLRDLGVKSPPSQWDDLGDPIYIGQIGAADPTKSGSVAKAFEMMIHQKCYQAVRAAGFSDAQMDEFEKKIRDAKLPMGELPPDVPREYQDAVERGWLDGLRLVQRIGANARYFTDSAGKVPVDVSAGDAAAGLCIDFFGRFQAEISRGPNGEERMKYVTPVGGSSVSCDPISLMRGAPNRELAVRFIEFVLSEDGQKLWTYRVGTPGGPEKFALRRLPIRRDFYPSDIPAIQATHERHAEFSSENLADPAIDPYQLSKTFTYRARWTAGHFNIHRDLIRAMCLDSADELKAAWRAINENGGPEKQKAAMELLGKMPDTPEPLTWRNAPDVGKRFDRLTYMKEWTAFFRANYRKAEAEARK
jgi:ABC-type Fe3+ transport system substrate-binding protein